MKSDPKTSPISTVVPTSRLLLTHGLLALATALLAGLTVVLFEAVSASLGDLAPEWFLSFTGLAAPLAWCWVWLQIRKVGETAWRQPKGAARLVTLPESTALAHFLCWFLAGGVAGLALVAVDGFRPARSLMLVLVGLLAGTGASLVALVQTRRVLEPVWDRAIATLQGHPKLQKRARVPLRRQMALFLGGLVFFSSGLALFTAFAIQREVVSYYIEERAGQVADEWERLSSTGDVSCTGLGRLTPRNGAVVTRLSGDICMQGVSLSPAVVENLVTGSGSYVSVPSSNLEGIRVSTTEGAVVVLVPKPEWARRVLLVSLLFFTMLYLLSSWLAVQIARNVTRPILRLRSAVEGIERGDLETPVQPTSLDELGDLSVSVETMRSSLAETLEQVRQLNLSLEDKVEQRTAELRQANQKLQQAMVDLKSAQSQLVHAEKMAGLGRLMSGLAHELNNPINAIVNSIVPLKKNLDRLEGSTDDKALSRVRKAFGIVEHASHRTVDLIQSLSTFSRPHEQGNKQVDINAQLEATLLLLQHRFESQKTTLERHLGELPDFWGHPGELGQVMMNLLANALDAVESLGESGSVTVSTSRGDNWIQLEVCDNGGGVPDEVRQRIFEPFFTTRDTGTGLGLAMSHEIVVRHRGTIELSQGAGACFTVRLPVDSREALV